MKKQTLEEVALSFLPNSEVEHDTDFIIGFEFGAKWQQEQAKEMEKQNLLDMSVKSALYERKWVYEEMSDKKYKPTKVEIRDLKITALEHYNETFKSE